MKILKIFLVMTVVILLMGKICVANSFSWQVKVTYNKSNNRHNKSFRNSRERPRYINWNHRNSWGGYCQNTTRVYHYHYYQLPKPLPVKTKKDNNFSSADEPDPAPPGKHLDY